MEYLKGLINISALQRILKEQGIEDTKENIKKVVENLELTLQVEFIELVIEDLK